LKGLNIHHYAPVFIDHEEIEPWIVFEQKMDKLENAATFLASNTKKISTINPEKFLDILDLFNDQASINLEKPLELTDLLNLLGIKSKGFESKAFISRDDYNDLFKNSTNVLLTEKFLSSSTVSTGSGRHALLGDLQVKGIGRNSLSNQIDYSHSWGGMLPIDCLKAIISDQIILQRCHFPPMQTIATFLYKKNPFNFKQAISFREADTFRACIFWDDVINNELRSIGTKHLESVFGNKNPNTILTEIFENYIHAFSKGVVHRTPTVDNLTVDGRWIDTESIDFKVKPEEHYKYINIFVHGKELPSVKNLRELYQLNQKIQFMGSWIHDLKIPCLISYKVFKNIYGDKLSIDFDEAFQKILHKHNLGSQDWYTLINNYNCIKQMNLSNESFDSLLEAKEIDLSHADDYLCVGNFYDHVYKGNLMLFSEKEDSSRESLSFLEKWNLVINKDELDFNKAFANAKRLEILT